MDSEENSRTESLTGEMSSSAKAVQLSSKATAFSIAAIMGGVSASTAPDSPRPKESLPTLGKYLCLIQYQMVKKIENEKLKKKTVEVYFL